MKPLIFVKLPQPNNIRHTHVSKIKLLNNNHKQEYLIKREIFIITFTAYDY